MTFLEYLKQKIWSDRRDIITMSELNYCYLTLILNQQIMENIHYVTRIKKCSYINHKYVLLICKITYILNYNRVKNFELNLK